MAKLDLPPLGDEGADEKLEKQIQAIAKAVQMPIAFPHLKKREALIRYLAQFSGDEFAVFIAKLSTSMWVKNATFGIDILVRKDIVTTLLHGQKQVRDALKFYKVKQIFVEAGDGM